MSVRTLSAVAALAVALVAGCAHSDLRVPREEQTVTFLPHLTVAQTRGLTSVAWESPASTGPGDGVFLAVSGAACPRLRGAVVTETTDQVTIQIFATLTHCSDGGAAYVVAPVRLASPLGSRRLIHGPVMRPLPGISNGPPARRL